MTGWRQEAACAGADPELFFPLTAAAQHTDQVTRARSYCVRCEVIAECERMAARLESRGVRVHGIWYGTTEGERDLMRAQARETRQAVAR